MTPTSHFTVTSICDRPLVCMHSANGQRSFAACGSRPALLVARKRARRRRRGGRHG